MNRRDKIRKWIIAICAGAFLLSGGMFLHIWQTSRSEEARFQELSQLAATPDPTPEPTATAEEPSPAPEETPQPESTDNRERFAQLTERNEHFIGWLTIPGTQVDYPIMHTPSYPQYYMSRDFDQKRSNSGTPFMDAKSQLTDNHVIIYGHNMHTGTMFADLLKYNDESFYAQHPTFSFDTLDESAEYEIIAAFREVVHYKDETDVFRYYNFTGDLSETRFNEYLSEIKAACAYDIEATAEYGDKLISLSTCSKHVENGRFVVVGRKIVEES